MLEKLPGLTAAEQTAWETIIDCPSVSSQTDYLKAVMEGAKAIRRITKENAALTKERDEARRCAMQNEDGERIWRTQLSSERERSAAMREALVKAEALYKAANRSLEDTDEDPPEEKHMEMAQVYTLRSAWARLCDAVDEIDVDGPGFAHLLSSPADKPAPKEHRDCNNGCDHAGAHPCECRNCAPKEAKPCQCGNPIDRTILPTGDKCQECVI